MYQGVLVPAQQASHRTFSLAHSQPIGCQMGRLWTQNCSMCSLAGLSSKRVPMQRSSPDQCLLLLSGALRSMHAQQAICGSPSWHLEEAAGVGRHSLQGRFLPLF